ncbi:sugar phosphate isomerase/epimerase family protein [Pseudobacter ginsenosidimutans]|uniref:Sugar phosphate isomerase/epimerase n=1 Tax=Pseudobacter ginsenosidimutans TaxID=661488 RepID=A0A4Q7MV59_9BACT|nr:sugar phosphate isomerase/epimerase [Pseudobacter ginsenosidimutans]RZS71879.1 sugar phosphate isomerase/epimerase [Pseudobacter ginsenosidimutans]
MNTRRQFLKQSSIFTAAMFVMPEDAFSLARKRYGVQLYTLRKELDANPTETIISVAKLGYTDVETYGYNNGKWFGFTVDEFRKLLKANKLTSTSGHTFGGQFFLTETNWEEKWKQAVQDSKAIGQEFIVVPYLDNNHRSIDTYKKLAPLLNKAGEMAKQGGLKLAYHNHDFEFAVQDGQTGFEILTANTDPGLVSFELDIYWATKAGHNAIDLFNKYPGRFTMWHVKDMDNTPEKKFTEVGNGVIDFPAIFKQAKLSGMKYWFVEQDVCPGSPLDSIKTSITNLKEKILK